MGASAPAPGLVPPVPLDLTEDREGNKAEGKPPSGYHQAPIEPAAGSPHASLKLPTCTPQATPEPPPCDIKATSERHQGVLIAKW